MIESIFISDKHGKEQRPVQAIEVVAGQGIIGDRNYGKTKWPGQNITFVELEEINNFNRDHGQNISLDATRRNVVTKGVALNALVGKIFYIGDVKFFGVELCEPCAKLGELLETQTLSKKAAVKALVGKGGLRADALSNGKLTVGMAFTRQEDM
ncbi:sulfurase [Exilibacterium tricleocarpae]|uniref:Sulfurase n=1 Tax=Exilibacterium tricleocarpae TaxID=2591008 RepID=A0A545SXH1_9GAMM|nr:MOSC domain-containing protein [Exilibacterium tricleocarpae]TQV69657.1 sulfurase [Exilibacterium tricleocarpae]